MELREAVRQRRMVRTYDPDRPVPRELVDELLRLAIRAPSAGYSQGWRFLVLDDITSRSRSGQPPRTATPDAWLTPDAAPRRCLVVCFSDKDGLPRPLRRAGQGLDRPRRGALAGALLAHRHRHGRDDHAARPRSTPGWAPASSGCPPERWDGAARGVRRAGRGWRRSAWSAWATRRPTAARRRCAAAAGLDEVVALRLVLTPPVRRCRLRSDHSRGRGRCGRQLRRHQATSRSRSSMEPNSTVILPLRRPSSTRTRVS